MSEMQFTLAETRPASQKLTDWKKEPSKSDLYADFLGSKTSHDTQITRIQKWNDLMSVSGSAKPKEIAGRSKVQPKLIRRQAEWRYSALTEPFLGSAKLFKVSPVTFEDGDAARQNELVLNWQFRTKFNRVKFIDDMVRSTVDEGTCIIRTGWKRASIKVKTEEPTYTHYPITDEKTAQQFQQMLELSQTDPRGFKENAPPEMIAAIDFYNESGQITIAQQTGTTTVTKDKIIENRPTVQILNPRNVYIDPSCEGDMEKAMFVIVLFETSQAELKKDGRYKNLDNINWDAVPAALAQPDYTTTTSDPSYQFKDTPRKRIVAYEYWGFYDVDGDGVLTPIVATWIGDTMIRMERNPFPDEKLPFVVIPYLPVKRELYGEPDAELLEDNQAILGALTRGMIDLLGRSANSQKGIQKGMLDVLNRRRFENGQDYEYNPGTNPTVGLVEHKYPELPQSALLMLNLQNQEAEALTGVKSFGGGISGEAYGDVAAGIKGVLDAASKREMAILRRLAKGMMEIGQKLISMNGVFLSQDEVVRVTNDEFVKVSPEDLKGDFDLEVDISTAEVDQAKSQDLGFMLQTIGPNFPLPMVQMVLAEICRLKRMPELEHAIKMYKPEPDPMQQQLQQLEMQKLQKEIEKLDSEVQKNLAEAQRKQAETDKTNLDFVEQETGTTHEREMQRQRAQAQGNQDLEVTKALLKPLKTATGSEKKPDVETAIGYNQLTKPPVDHNNSFAL
ncbi:putative portal protein [Rhizobium phage RHph_Y2_6]|uniref:Putative portal protein n=1 Tax=Rhizobium phage RHph_Y2_6 TaxID=2509576 RepID=A0A7S5USD1_9CAUD|nr:portal protein [Rhizobium phage RHph_Y2_6]QIG68820.1 putative portal protein [Rhizobium phage RHph_Y2_6]